MDSEDTDHHQASLDDLAVDHGTGQTSTKPSESIEAGALAELVKNYPVVC
ncbi:hypothetical protein [Halosimplex halophilum]|nr:hypothetical protein [Halosimplex halophilum]